MKKGVSYLLQAALAVGCLAYAFAGVDLGSVLEQLRAFDPVALLGILAVTALAYVVMGLRLAALAPGPIRLGTGIAASVLCIGLNSLLPARLGEVAKGLHLHQRAGLPAQGLLTMVLVERLFDVVVLLGLGVTLAVSLGRDIPGPALVAALLAALGCLALVVRYPALGNALVNLAPHQRLRHFLRGALEALRAYSSLRRLAVPALLTLVLWGLSLAYVALVILWLAGLPLDMTQVLTVFTTSMAGNAVPGAPGGLGVYEGAVVASLGWAGIAKGQALAVAVVLRAYNSIPPVLGAAWVLWRSDLRLDKLWKKRDVSQH